MPDFERDGPARELPTQRRLDDSNAQESKSMMTIIAIGIAGLFIVAAITAFNYFSSDHVALNDRVPDTASTPATRAAPETTGSGSNLPPERQVPDRSMKQQ